MSESWITVPVGDIADIYDGPHATPAKTPAGPWFLSISSLQGGRLALHESSHVDEADFRKWSRRVTPHEGDVLFSYETRLGEAALMPPGIVACLGRRMGLLRPKNINPRFLLYAYLGPQFQAEIERRAVRGATVDRIPLNELARWPLRVPSRRIQDAIAEVLGALDDKIEANSKTQQLCNDLANIALERVLARGADRGELRSAPLGDVATVNARSVKPKNGGIRYLDISSVGDGRVDEPLAMPWSEAPGRARRAAADGDVIWSTVRPNRRSHCLLLDPPADLVVSTGFAVLTPRSVGSSFLFGVTDRPQFVEWLNSVAEGSAYPAVRAERFAEAPIPMPTVASLQEYEATTMPLRRYAARLVEESRCLSRLRDLLLPPLMVGELRLRDAEVLVGEAL